MPNTQFSRKEKLGAGVTLGVCILLLASFYQSKTNRQPTTNCIPNARPFSGYTFLHPDIVNKNAAYAPFLLKWDDYYQQYYFNKDIQKQENIEEWIERFCGQPEAGDVEFVVYEANIDELVRLRNVALSKGKKGTLPYRMSGNTFAEMLALNGCTEVIDYLMYAKKCEPYVIAQGDGWTLPERDPEAMYELINEGRGRFKQTNSYFVKLRYAYQIVRLAHYARNWQYTVDLYNELIPKLDLKKSSIIFYWTLGHLAGAYQKLGKYPEAAYRYSLVFRHCPSKRTQAFRSFLIRNDKDWEETLRFCQKDDEKSTLYLLRSGHSRAFAIQDIQQVYELDKSNPQLELLFVSDVLELEKIFLRTPVTDRKYGAIKSAMKRKNAEQHLLDLQKFARTVVREKLSVNPNFWLAMEGYLELLAGDRYAAGHTFDRVEKSLSKRDDYDKKLLHQLEIWRVLLDIMNLDPADEKFRDNMAFRVRSYDAFKYNPHFESFLQDWLSTGYIESQHPGKAILAAYPPAALGYNPDLAVLDDLLKLSAENSPILLERTMQIDTNPDRIRAQLLEIKGAYFLSLGKPEAALLALRDIKPIEAAKLTKFTPFKEHFGEKLARVTDTLQLNRRQIAEYVIDYEFRAKAAEAAGDPSAAWYYYRIGLGYYNMSYFGYEWKALDFLRDGYNWLRLAQGPVFPLRGSPNGNRETLDMSIALFYFERAYQLAKDSEFSARIAFMAARCQQKQWFCDKDCTYKPGSRLIPVLPENYRTYYDRLMTRYSKTDFYDAIVQECKWLEAYAR